jgi:hypothetical protein
MLVFETGYNVSALGEIDRGTDKLIAWQSRQVSSHFLVQLIIDYSSSWVL